MRDLCFLKEDTLWISRQVSNNYVQILADRPGQWGQGEVRSKRPASPAMGYGLRALKMKSFYTNHIWGTTLGPQKECLLL